jgi:Xaa-Pro aminopeptidase
MLALRQKMNERKIDVYYIPSSDAHLSEYVGEHFKTGRFVSGFTGSAGIIVVSKEETALFTDGRYFIQAERQLKDTGITLYRIGEPGVISVMDYVAKLLLENGVLGFDGKVVSADTIWEIRQKTKEKNIRMISQYDLVGEIWEKRPPLAFTETFLLSPEYTGEIFSEKIRRIREKMKKIGANYHIVASLDDIAWIFNLRGHDIKNNPVNLSYAAISPQKVILYIKEEKLSKVVKDDLMKNHIVVRDYEEIYQDIKKLHEKSILLDRSRINYTIYEHLKNRNHLLFAENPSYLMKACKNKTEQKNIRNAHVRDGVACTKFLYWLKHEIIAKGKAGMISESDIIKKLEELRMEQKNYLEPSFETIAAVGENAAMMHYQPDSQKPTYLEDGKLLLVDSGGQYLDGTTDITRTFAIGQVSEMLKKHVTLVLKGMLHLAKTKFLYGVTGTHLDVLAREPIWKYGIDYKCGTGHGIGFLLNVHEGPQRIAMTYSRQVLEEGMIVTDEPGIYIKNSHGIRIENELLIQKAEKTEFGQFMTFETITYVPIDLDCILSGLLTEEEKEFLNFYHQTVREKISSYLTEEERFWMLEHTENL